MSLCVASSPRCSKNVPIICGEALHNDALCNSFFGLLVRLSSNFICCAGSAVVWVMFQFVLLLLLVLLVLVGLLGDFRNITCVFYVLRALTTASRSRTPEAQRFILPAVFLCLFGLVFFVVLRFSSC